jgi:hypothetical protein
MRSGAISLQNRDVLFLLDDNHPNCIDTSKEPFYTLLPGFITC